MTPEAKFMVKFFGTLALIGSTFIGSCMYGYPQYKVYTATMSGKAIQAKQEHARQALVGKAQAELDAADLQAQAIAIVGQAYKDFPEYRDAMYMEAMAEALTNGNVRHMMYIPTENAVPITEAGRAVQFTEQ